MFGSWPASSWLRVLFRYEKYNYPVLCQVLNLAAKLCLTNPKQTKVLTQYVLNLAKYDMNYDLRDRQAAFFITLVYEIKYMLYKNYVKI
jgi:hypothetical protein